MSSSASRIVIDNLVWRIEQAFEGDPSHLLLVNVSDLQEQDWTATPLGSHRSIANILEAGEINHLRVLLQGTDRWEYE